MLNKLILFLIRRKLNLRKFQLFYFNNQVNKNDRYFFNDYRIVKITFHKEYGRITQNSNLSLNFLLSKECETLIRSGRRYGK